MCGLEQASEPLFPSVSFSVKWVHSLLVLCCGGDGEYLGSPSLAARHEIVFISQMGKQR